MPVRLGAKQAFYRPSFIQKNSSPIIQITNGTFYRHHPSSVPIGPGKGTQGREAIPNPPLFPDLNFTLPSFPTSSFPPEYWTILGPSSSGKTTFLQILQGQHLCYPDPLARSYPYLSSEEIEKKDHQLRNPSRAIQYVGFGGEGGSLPGQATKGAYLSARYESRREATDFSLLNYLQGRTELNPLEEADNEGKSTDRESLERVVRDLRLGELIDMPVSNLSNGQTRRAKIARALLGKPEVLLLDEPFMGLDPPTLTTLSPLLYGLAQANVPRLVLTLRPQDPIPEWITHVLYLKPECGVAFMGKKDAVLGELREFAKEVRAGKRKAETHVPPVQSLHEIGRTLTERGIVEHGVSVEPWVEQEFEEEDKTPLGEPLVEMSGVKVSYGPKTVLGNWSQNIDGETKQGLWWTIRRGQRWGIFGPNGSGKTTVLSLICSDHPQTYSLPILLFGHSRLPEPGRPGISIFDIQARIGHSSPEIHHHMPRSLTLRQTLENAWAETFKGVPTLDENANKKVDAALRWFEPELRPGGAVSAPSDSDTDEKTFDFDRDVSWATNHLFGELPFSSQRVALFLRAVIKNPDLVILDEAFSGMDEAVRDKCMLFLSHGESRTFAWSSTTSSSTSAPSKSKDSEEDHRSIVPSPHANANRVTVSGLGPEQALLCISHVREEIPGCIREWICLPEANEGRPARFGKLAGPIDGDVGRWNEIWGM